MASNRQQALRAGTSIDGFEIRKVIGTGGFGVTYEAFDTSLERAVAIKEYCPQGIAEREPGNTTLRANDPAHEDTFNYGLSRFLDEARTLARFQHPSIVHVHRFLEANGTGYLIMDFEQGQTLWSVLRRHAPLGEAAVLSLLNPLLEGLRVVHEQSFLHRDIKPANVLMRDKGAPVLLDFGAARLAMEQQSGELTVMLTPGYAPLEQYSATDQQGAWTDLYALGGTAYHCMIGQAPMAATERIARMHSTQADDVNARLQDARGRYSAQLLQTVQWMLEPIAERRPRDADQVLSQLQDLEPATHTGGSTRGNAPPVEFEASPALTHALQNTLEKHAGRIARKVVPRAVSTATNYDDLVNHLAGYVLDPEREIEFRALATELPARASEAATQALSEQRSSAAELDPPGTGSGEDAAGPPTSLRDDVIDKAQTHLAHYVGPIAAVLIEDAAAQARDATQFHNLLADEIDDPDDREKFLAAVK
ncbi:MAG: serine/threonine protein kinase [Gammaproteobacteria bacterium]|jgi:serine/threonine protein kinase